MNAAPTKRRCAPPPWSAKPLLLFLLLLSALADNSRLSSAFASAPGPSRWSLGGVLRAMIPGRSSSRLFAGVEPDEPVPFSSRQMSAVRALEAERPDRLFSDPLSKHFAGEEAMRQAHERTNASRASQGVGRKIAVRTRFFDDFLLDCCGDAPLHPPPRRRRMRQRLASFLRALASFAGLRRGTPSPLPAAAREPIRQVLILGCGMDTRAWRLPLRGTNNSGPVVVVEVDVAPVLRAKEGVLREVQAARRREGLPEIPLTVGDRRAVAADLADPDDDWPARVARALDVRRPVAVVMEGLLMYLSEEEVRTVLARVGALAAAPGSRVGISLVDWRSVQDAQASSSPLRRTWKWGCDEDKCRAFFEAALSAGRDGGRKGAGWRVMHVTKVGATGPYPDGANYGCWRNMGKWKRVGKTLYVLAERTLEEGRRGRSV